MEEIQFQQLISPEDLTELRRQLSQAKADLGLQAQENNSIKKLIFDIELSKKDTLQQLDRKNLHLKQLSREALKLAKKTLELSRTIDQLQKGRQRQRQSQLQHNKLKEKAQNIQSLLTKAEKQVIQLRNQLKKEKQQIYSLRIEVQIHTQTIKSMNLAKSELQRLNKQCIDNCQRKIASLSQQILGLSAKLEAIQSKETFKSFHEQPFQINRELRASQIFEMDINDELCLDLYKKENKQLEEKIYNIEKQKAELNLKLAQAVQNSLEAQQHIKYQVRRCQQIEMSYSMLQAELNLSKQSPFSKVQFCAIEDWKVFKTSLELGGEDRHSRQRMMRQRKDLFHKIIEEAFLDFKAIK